MNLPLLNLSDTKRRLLQLVLLVFLLLINGVDGSVKSNGLCSLQFIGQHLRHAKDDYMFYGVTQDCQLFFGTRHQTEELREIPVNLNITTCYPNLVKLHLRRHAGQVGLMLFLRQADNRICVLPVDLPDPHTLVGPRLFRYSLRSAITYAPCSQLPDATFDLEPDLSFLDTSFSDVVYFVNAKSTGAKWKVRQFQMDENNQFKALDRFILKQQVIAESYGMDVANEYAIDLDPQYSELYTMHRFSKSLQSQCAFDALFRPERSEPKMHSFDVPSGLRGRSKWVDSFVVDGDLLVYAESLREPTGRSSTHLYIADLDESKGGKRSSCIGHVNYVLDFGFLLQGTLKHFRLNPLPIRGDPTICTVYFTVIGTSPYPQKHPLPTIPSFQLYSNQTITPSKQLKLLTTSTIRPIKLLPTDFTVIHKEKFSITSPSRTIRLTTTTVKTTVNMKEVTMEKSGESSAVGKMEDVTEKPMEKSGEEEEEEEEDGSMEVVLESTGRPRAGKIGGGGDAQSEGQAEAGQEEKRPLYMNRTRPSSSSTVIFCVTGLKTFLTMLMLLL